MHMVTQGRDAALLPLRRIRFWYAALILIVLACLLGLLYLTQVTKTNAYGYTINGLKEKQSALQAKHDDLEVASARLQSLDRVQHSTVASSLTPVTPSGTVTK
jgi:hypothetical protein